MTDSIPRHCAKPPPRYLQAGESAVDKDERLETKVQFDNLIVRNYNPTT